MARFNFPYEEIILTKRLFPTLLTRPDWDTFNPPPRIMGIGPPGRPGRVTNFSAKRIGAFTDAGLCSAPSQPDAPLTLDYERIEAFSRGMAPITEPDIVEWMFSAHASQIIIEGLEEEYKRAGSFLAGNSGDPYIPGVSSEDLRFRSERGETVARRGTGVVVTPRGNFSCPVPGKTPGIFSDLLSWAAILDAWRVQWTGVLLKWLNLATNPQDRIRFGNFRGLVAPQFIGHEVDAPVPVNFVNMKISSDKSQTVIVKYREPNDYTQTIASVDAPLTSGQNEVTYNLMCIPFVPAMAVEIQPEDGTQTVLDSYSPSALPV